MKKKNYKWISRLINKITKTDCPNNCDFIYYNHAMHLQSGMRDYVDVSVITMTNFSFDFLTKELVFESYMDFDIRDTIICALKHIYGRLTIYDYPFEEYKDFYKPMIDNEEYDQENIMKEYNDLLSHKVA